MTMGLRRRPPDYATLIFAEHSTYASVIPQDKLVQSKATTHDIERTHGRQRHWFGRFKRKSIIVSNSKEMVDLTMALFPKFWVNGNQDELVSLLD
jgi:insertion element IS1 protein InsB